MIEQRFKLSRVASLPPPILPLEAQKIFFAYALVCNCAVISLHRRLSGSSLPPSCRYNTVWVLPFAHWEKLEELGDL